MSPSLSSPMYPSTSTSTSTSQPPPPPPPPPSISSSLPTNNDHHLRQQKQSLAIPLPASHIHRTASELQLQDDTAVAEYRDQCMFNRLIRGIRHQQRRCYDKDNDHHNGTNSKKRGEWNGMMTSSEFMEESERCVTNIMSTRRHRLGTLPDLDLETETIVGDSYNSGNNSDRSNRGNSRRLRNQSPGDDGGTGTPPPDDPPCTTSDAEVVRVNAAHMRAFPRPNTTVATKSTCESTTCTTSHRPSIDDEHDVEDECAVGEEEDDWAIQGFTTMQHSSPPSSRTTPTAVVPSSEECCDRWCPSSTITNGEEESSYHDDDQVFEIDL